MLISVVTVRISVINEARGRTNTDRLREEGMRVGGIWSRLVRGSIYWWTHTACVYVQNVECAQKMFVTMSSNNIRICNLVINTKLLPVTTKLIFILIANEKSIGQWQKSTSYQKSCTTRISWFMINLQNVSALSAIHRGKNHHSRHILQKVILPHILQTNLIISLIPK